MKLLIITQYFPPEIGAAAERISSLARYVASRCELTVIAPVPSYPWEHVMDGYKELDGSQTDRGYELIRCHKIPKSKNLLVRLISELAYSANCFRYALRLPRHDMVLVTSPTFFLGITALLLRWIRRSEFIFDIRDLYPASVQQAGFLKKGLILGMLQLLERKIYRRARLVSVVNPGWIKDVKLYASKVIAVPNGVDIDAFLRKSNSQPGISERQRRLLVDNFPVVYVGNLGTFYDNSLYLKAAKHFLASGEHKFQFIFIGEGSHKLAMEQLVSREKLSNVHFWEPIPNDQLAAVLKMCSVGMVAWRSNIDFLEYNVPNKIYEYLAADLDVVACLPGGMPKYLIDSGKVFEHNNTDLDSFLEHLRLLESRDQRQSTPKDLLYKISRERQFKRFWYHISRLDLPHGNKAVAVAGGQAGADLPHNTEVGNNN